MDPIVKVSGFPTTKVAWSAKRRRTTSAWVVSSLGAFAALCFVLGCAAGIESNGRRLGSSDDRVGGGAKARIGLANPEGAWSLGRCPEGMASIDGRYCIDRYEASLMEILPNGEERPYSPYRSVAGHVVRAVSKKGVHPQAYVSANDAARACEHSGKRLCKPAEWKKACAGPEEATYGYSHERVPNRCNDHGTSAYATQARMGGGNGLNDPTLNQHPGTLAPSGSHASCTNGYGVYDMVGNVHEWVNDPQGTFLGGYYQDTHLNGDGCNYETTAHSASYHDYSTGFRCCADVEM
jgi:sulfatase modifying factor 1